MPKRPTGNATPTPHVRKCKKNPARVARITLLIQMANIDKPFDLVGECSSSVIVTLSYGCATVVSANWRYYFTKRAFTCLFDLPIVTASDCLGVSLSSFEEIKRDFGVDYWPCSGIYKYGNPVTPDFVAEARAAYIEWMKRTEIGTSNARLLYALQIAEKASIDHQRRLGVGSLKSSLAVAIEMAEVKARVKARVAGQVDVYFSEPEDEVPKSVDIVFMGEVITPDPFPPGQAAAAVEDSLPEFPLDFDLTFAFGGDGVSIADCATTEEVDLFSMD